jgi:hypothetical protein
MKLCLLFLFLLPLLLNVVCAKKSERKKKDILQEIEPDKLTHKNHAKTCLSSHAKRRACLKTWAAEYNHDPSKVNMTAFDDNLLRIIQVNSDPNSTWYAGLNDFSHLSPQQFQETMLMKIPKDKTRLEKRAIQPFANPYAGVNFGDVEPDLDWRNKSIPATDNVNSVSPVKSQGSCGSCWYAFHQNTTFLPGS